MTTDHPPCGGYPAPTTTAMNLFAEVVEKHYPSVHQETDEPPEGPNPELGTESPIGEECPTCGYARLRWIYNPFVKKSVRGWIQYRSPLCHCPESDPSGRIKGATERRDEPTREPLHDQSWLDGQFLQRPTYAQTFLSFRCPEGSPLRPLLDAAHAFAQRPAQPTGLYLAGPASIGKAHLVTALANSARAQGILALSVTVTTALDLSLNNDREPTGEAEARCLRRKALRAVPVLALKDLFRQPLLPTEVKELDLLLDYREGRELTTHFTSPFSFAQLHTLPGRSDARAALIRRVERLTAQEVVAKPGTAPFTERMARAGAGAR